MKITPAIAAALAAVIALAGCTTGSSPDASAAAETSAAEASATEWKPWRASDNPWADVAAFDYQLGGGYEPPAGVSLVARDRTDTPSGTSICYINGFQTQPGELSVWRKHPTLLLRDSRGRAIRDKNWPDEILLDTSTASKRTAITRIIGRWIDGCARDGFAAVEFDNLDSYTRSGKRLRQAENLALAKLLVRRAHANDLWAGQKNSAEMTAAAYKIGFDFAVAEECHRWNECASYSAVYRERVIDIEYTDDLRGSADSVCASAARPRLTIIRDRDLVTPDNPDYFYRAC